MLFAGLKVWGLCQIWRFESGVLILVYPKAQKSEKMQSSSPQVTTNLYINPSYITGRFDTTQKTRSKLQFNARVSNFKANYHRGKVSKQSARKIRMAVQWLVLMADKKKVWDKHSCKMIDYRAGLATVSLPTGCTNVSERFFRDTLLVSILSAMNYRWGLKNYVWKIERQKNGTLHAHITLDKFIDHKWLLSKWCSTLDKHGLLEEYRSRFQQMSVKDYVNYRQSRDQHNYKTRFKSHIQYTKSLIAAYQKGEKSNWSLPNCTDIHAVKNVRHLAAYMVKYMSKDPNLGIDFKGRYWACSHSLSKLRSIKVNLPECDLPRFTKFINQSITGLEDIYYINKRDQDVRFLGFIYFLKRSVSQLYQNPFLSQLFGIVKSLYDSSGLDELPEFELRRDHDKMFNLNPIYQHAN